MTRNRNVADVQSNGISAVPPSTAGKNAVINGGFDIWQRGTSFANPASYFADRWTSAGPSAGVNNVTISRETTGVPAGSQYLLRMTSTGATSYCSLNQFIETANVVPLQGKTVTYSFKVRRNSTLNNSGILVIINKSSAIDAGTGGTYSNITTASVSLADIPTTAGTSTATYYNASVTFTVPNDGTCNSLYLQIAYNGGAQSGSILEYSQMQLEVGSTATPFSRNASSIQGELAACQRYYYRTNSGGLAYSQTPTMVMGGSGNGYFAVAYPPVKMRVAPTSLDFSNLAVWDGLVTSAISTAALLANQSSSEAVAFSGAAGATTQYRPYSIINNNNTAGYLGFSAEL